jgi:hypothetical protein
MGTSRSNNWTACALVFSGRPSPTWPLASTDALRLIGLWSALPATDNAAPNTPKLGYAGCVLEDGAGTEWRAHDGVAVSTSGTTIETRADTERRFERGILATAPADVLPPRIVLQFF